MSYTEGGYTCTDNDTMDKIKGMPAKAVFAALCRFRNKKTGLCYPSLTTISKAAGCSGRTTIRMIAYLVENNIIKVIKGTGSVNHYSIPGKLSIGLKPNYIKEKQTYPQTYPQAGITKPSYQCHTVTSCTLPVTHSHYTSDTQSRVPVTHSHTNNTTNNTKNKTTAVLQNKRKKDSSSFLNYSENKKAKGSKQQLLDWWKKKGSDLLNHTGFTEDHLSQLAANRRLSTKDVISSLEDYAIYLKYDKRAEKIGNKIGYIMKILRVEGGRYKAPPVAKRLAMAEEAAKANAIKRLLGGFHE